MKSAKLTQEQIAVLYCGGHLTLVRTWDHAPECNLVAFSCVDTVRVVHTDENLRPLRSYSYCPYAAKSRQPVKTLRIVDDGNVLVTYSDGKMSLLDVKVGVFREVAEADAKQQQGAPLGDVQHISA